MCLRERERERRERERERKREIAAELRRFENIFKDVATIHCDENDDNYVRDSGFSYVHVTFSSKLRLKGFIMGIIQENM